MRVQSTVAQIEFLLNRKKEITMTMNNNSKKTIGSKKNSKVTIVDVTNVNAAPVVEQVVTPVTVATDATVQMEKEITNMTTTSPIVTMKETGTESPALTPKKRGGLTKEQRAERAKEMSEIRARLVSNSTSEFKNGTMSPGDFAQVMLDLEKKVEEEYRKLHPKKSVGSGLGRGRREKDVLALMKFRTFLGFMSRKYELDVAALQGMFERAISLPLPEKRKRVLKNTTQE